MEAAAYEIDENKMHTKYSGFTVYVCVCMCVHVYMWTNMIFHLELKQIQILSKPSPNRVIERNSGYSRIPLDI